MRLRKYWYEVIDDYRGPQAIDEEFDAVDASLVDLSGHQNFHHAILVLTQVAQVRQDVIV